MPFLKLSHKFFCFWLRSDPTGAQEVLIFVMSVSTLSREVNRHISSSESIDRALHSEHSYIEQSEGNQRAVRDNLVIISIFPFIIGVLGPRNSVNLMLSAEQRNYLCTSHSILIFAGRRWDVALSMYFHCFSLVGQ